MLFLRFVLLLSCFGLLAGAAGTVIYDIFLAFELNRILRRGERSSDATPPGETQVRATGFPRPRRVIRWNAAAKLVPIAAVLGLLGSSILVVPDGQAAVRISQISGVRPGTLYAGTHLIFPLVDRVAFFDVRDRVFSTAAIGVRGGNEGVLVVQAHEGLAVGWP